jgi:very-short-patch-repair endonuclease
LVTTAIQRELCSVEQLTAQLRRAPRRNSAALRLTLSDAVAGARSVAEAEAAELLRLGGVPRFELNVAIVHAGRVIAVADVLWRELRAVLEIDGREYQLSEAHWKATMARHNRLTAAGYAVTHYPPSAMRDRGLAWVAEVDDWLRARALELGRQSPPPAISR